MKHGLIFVMVFLLAVGQPMLAEASSVDQSQTASEGWYFNASSQMELLQQRFDELLPFYSEVPPQAREILLRSENQGLLTEVVSKLLGLRYKGFEQVARDLATADSLKRTSRGGLVEVLEALQAALISLSAVLMTISPALAPIIQIVLVVLPIVIEFIKLIDGGLNSAALKKLNPTG